MTSIILRFGNDRGRRHLSFLCFGRAFLGAAQTIKEPPSAEDDFPAELLDPKAKVVVHILARKGNQGAYRSLGLGHLDGKIERRVARFRLVPGLDADAWHAIGGYGGWTIHINDRLSGQGSTHRLRKKSDAAAELKQAESLSSASIVARRWGLGEMKLVVEEGRTSLTYRSDQEPGPCVRHWVAPPPARPGGNELSQRPDGKGRRAAPHLPMPLKMIEMFVLGNGHLPSPSQWVAADREALPEEPDAKQELLVAAMRRYRIESPPVELRWVEAAPGKRLKPWGALRHPCRVFDFAVSTGCLMSAAGTRTWVWDLTDRKLESEEDYGFGPIVVALGHRSEGPPIAVSSGKSVFVMGGGPDDQEARSLTSASPNFGRIREMAFSPNDRRLMAVSHSGEASMWDIRTGQELWHLRPQDGKVLSVGFSFSSEAFAAYCDGGDLVVRDLDHDSEKMRVKAGASIRLAAFFDGCGRLAVEVEAGVQVWHVDSVRQSIAIGGFGDGVAPIAGSANGRHLAIAPPLGPAIVIDLKRAEQLATLGADDESLGPLRFSLDGRTLLAAADEGIRIWDIAAMRRRAEPEGRRCRT